MELGAKYGVKGISWKSPWRSPCKRQKPWWICAKSTTSKPLCATSRNILSQMRSLKKRIEDGEIGEIRKIHVETQAWFSQLGTHYVDYTLWANGGHRAK